MHAVKLPQQAHLGKLGISCKALLEHILHGFDIVVGDTLHLLTQALVS